MISGRSKAISLLGVVALAVPLVVSAGAAAGPPVTFPIAQGADFTLMSKATTEDAMKVRFSGPSTIEFVQFTIAPKGTSGLEAHGGTAVVNVNEGTATLRTPEGGDCASRTVEAGAGFVVPAGNVHEVRNEGSEPLELYVTYLTASDADAAAPGAGPCEAATAEGVTAKVLNKSTIDAPLTAESTGSSDVYVGLVRVDPGSTAAGWHVHKRPVIAGIDAGDATVKVAHDGKCDVAVFPAKSGVLEEPGMVHRVDNAGKAKLHFYILGFAPSPEPLLAPSGTPEECNGS